MEKLKFVRKKIKIKIPSRLHMSLMDVQRLQRGQIGGGGIGIAINRNLIITLEVIESDSDEIVSNKSELIRYSLNIMRDKLHICEHFKVECSFDSAIIPHSGMGSNALIQTGTMYGINCMYGSKISIEKLIDIMHENYCEEEEEIIKRKVFCSGVAHNTFLRGGICFVDELGKFIYNYKLPENYKIILMKSVIGDVFNLEDDKRDETIIQLRKENDNNYFEQKNRIIRNEIIPELKLNNYRILADKMRKFALEDDTNFMIKNCKIGRIKYEELYQDIKDIPNLIMGVSGNAPLAYVISDKWERVLEICKKYDINASVYEIQNDGASIIEEVWV